jgi:hypothetical protein
LHSVFCILSGILTGLQSQAKSKRYTKDSNGLREIPKDATTIGR